MKYNPIHPHCGPFNSISKRAPTNPTDLICWKHDIDYKHELDAGRNPYLYSDADKRMIQALPSNSMYSASMKAKYKIGQVLKRYYAKEKYKKVKDGQKGIIDAKKKDWMNAMKSNRNMSLNTKRVGFPPGYNPRLAYKRRRVNPFKFRRFMYRRMYSRRRNRVIYKRGRRRNL